jgi:hypothetical protein
MSEKQITLTLLGIFAMLFVGGLAVAVLFAYLVYICIGLGVLLFLTIAGIAWRKWQHSRIPVNEDKREKLRLELEELERRERLRIERERHEHELRLEQERHAQELDLQRREHEIKEHILLTRATYDNNGNPPILLNQPGVHVTTLPPGNPPHALRSGKPDEQQKQLTQGAETKALPAPTDAYDLLKQGIWTPSKERLLIALAVERLLLVSIALAWHIALAGSTGGGKTNLLRLLLAQLVKFYQVYYISPAFAPVKANHEDWRQIQDHLQGPVACEPDEIRERIQWAVSEYKYRQLQERTGDFSWQKKPVYLVIDEYIAVCKMYPEAADEVSELLRFARQYLVFVIVASQDFLIKNIGGDSGARDCYRTVGYFGGDPTTARTLLDIQGTLPYEGELGKQGLLVVKAKEIPVSPGRVPFMSNRAIYELLGWPEDPILDDAPVMASVPAGNFAGITGYPEMEPLPMRSASPRQTDQTSRLYAEDDTSTEDLQNTVEVDIEPPGTSQEGARARQKRFTPEQEVKFVRLYRACGNIKDCLRAMHLGNDYGPHARQLVEQRKLRKVNL